MIPSRCWCGAGLDTVGYPRHGARVLTHCLFGSYQVALESAGSLSRAAQPVRRRSPDRPPQDFQTVREGGAQSSDDPSTSSPIAPKASASPSAPSTTPFTMLPLRHHAGGILLASIWTLAIAGIILAHERGTFQRAAVPL